MKFYFDGNQINEGTALMLFRRFYPELDRVEVLNMWNDCKHSEDARDNYLEDGLEIVTE